MRMTNSVVRLPCHIEGDSGSHSVIWRDAEGGKVGSSGRYSVEGTDLVINNANWADMGR